MKMYNLLLGVVGVGVGVVAAMCMCRYARTAQGEKIDEFYAGVIPGAFCWK